MGSHAVTDFLAGWKVSPVKSFRQFYREFGLAVIKRTAMQKARPNPEIQNVCQLPIRRKQGEMQSSHTLLWAAVVASPAPQKAQESRGQKRSTQTLGTSQPSKTVNLNTTRTAMDLGHVVQELARPPAEIPMIEGDFGDLSHCARCCSSNDTVGCTVKNIANRDHLDEKLGGHQRPPWNGRHLSCRCLDVTCLLHSCPCKQTFFDRTMRVGCWLSLFGIIALPVLQSDLLLAHHEETALQNRD